MSSHQLIKNSRVTINIKPPYLYQIWIHINIVVIKRYLFCKVFVYILELVIFPPLHPLIFCFRDISCSKFSEPIFENPYQIIFEYRFTLSTAFSAIRLKKNTSNTNKENLSIQIQISQKKREFLKEHTTRIS